MLEFIKKIESALITNEGALDDSGFITEAVYVEIAERISSQQEHDLLKEFSTALVNLNDVDQASIQEYANNNKGLLIQIYPVLNLFEAKGKKEGKAFDNIGKLYESFAYEKIKSKAMLTNAKVELGLLQRSIDIQSISAAAKKLISSAITQIGQPSWLPESHVVATSFIEVKEDKPLSIKEAVDKLLNYKNTEVSAAEINKNLTELQAKWQDDPVLKGFIEDLCEELGTRPEVREQTPKPSQSIFEWILEFLVKLFTGQFFTSEKDEKKDFLDAVKDSQVQCHRDQICIEGPTQKVGYTIKLVVGKHTKNAVSVKTSTEQIPIQSVTYNRHL